MDKITTKCPDRSPLCIAEALKGIISYKRVCDIGCREGDIMVVFSKYADSVIGVDSNSHNIKACREKGLEVLHQTFKDEIPKADIYYIWVSKHENIELLNRISEGIVILGGDPSVGEKYNVGGIVIPVPYDEGKGERQSGVFELTVIDKNPKKEEIKDESRKTEVSFRNSDQKQDAMVSRVLGKFKKPNRKGH
jgi:hypothetical protein